jgi:hypothetical protein
MAQTGTHPHLSLQQYVLFAILDIKNPGSLSIQIKLLREAVILQEELLKFNCKVVFNPIDEPLLSTTTAPTDNVVMNTTGKRIFHPCDKNY